MHISSSSGGTTYSPDHSLSVGNSDSEASVERRQRSLSPRSTWPEDIQKLVLEFLSIGDQLALTTTSKKWSQLRSDATPWKNNLQLTMTPRTEEELFQSIENMRSESSVALKVPVALNLSYLRVTDETLQYIASSLSVASRIESITLSIRDLSPTGFDHFQNLSKLAKLTTTHSSLSTLEALAACQHLSSLTTLHLDWNRIGDAGARALAESENLRSLTTLDLRANCIAAAGARALAASANLRSLTTLHLDGNEIAATGARALAESENLRSLTTLNLDFNEIGDDGARSLAASENLRSLTTLHLRANRIASAGAGARAIAACPLLRHLKGST